MNIYDQFLKTKLYDSWKSEDKKREKTSFWASYCEKPLFDLYHAWIGTEPTNPIEPEKLVMFEAAKMIELALVDKLTRLEICQKLDEQQYIKMERQGVPITGYIDGLFVDGSPLEVKTYYGDFQNADLAAGKPRQSYLMQLAVYMDFLNQNIGKLLYMNRGTGEIFEFTLNREPNTLKFKCLNVEFNLEDEYKRWANLYNNNVLLKIEPKSEYKYKYDIAEIVSARKSDISAARNNKAVFGSWQVKYSPYKDLIIEREGCGLGYSEDELKQIKELTKNYSSKK